MWSPGCGVTTPTDWSRCRPESTILCSSICFLELLLRTFWLSSWNRKGGANRKTVGPDHEGQLLSHSSSREVSHCFPCWLPPLRSEHTLKEKVLLCYVFISGFNVHRLMTKPCTQGSPELMQLWAKPRAILNMNIPRTVFLQRPEIQLERRAWKQIALCCKLPS